MSLHTYGLYLAAVVLISCTPGPNIFYVTTRSIRFGFGAAMLGMVGCLLALLIILSASVAGVSAFMLAMPTAFDILKGAGAAYLIYLAAVIAFSGPTKPGEGDGRGPMTFWGAAMFQWINAKGWVIVIGTITAYAAIAQFPINIAIQTLISLLVGTVSTVAWAFFGTALRPVLTSERLVRAFNILMAILLLASLYPVFMDA